MFFTKTQIEGFSGPLLRAYWIARLKSGKRLEFNWPIRFGRKWSQFLD